MASKDGSTEALVTVVKALENLNDEERQWVLQSAASRWKINVSGLTAGVGAFTASSGTATLGVNAGANAPDAQGAIDTKNIRTFMRLKAPTTDVQRVACLVYYLTQTTGQPAVKSKEINAAHIDSGGSKINMTRALDNATRQAKYLSNRGPKEKQLTTLGEDVVLALPSQEAARSVGSAGRKGKSRPKKSRKKVA